VSTPKQQLKRFGFTDVKVVKNEPDMQILSYREEGGKYYRLTFEKTSLGWLIVGERRIDDERTRRVE